MQQGFNPGRPNALGGGIPQLMEKHHIGTQRRLIHAFRRRAANKPARAVFAHKRFHHPAQPDALCLAFNALGHPADFAIRHEHLIDRGNANVCG